MHINEMLEKVEALIGEEIDIFDIVRRVGCGVDTAIQIRNTLDITWTGKYREGNNEPTFIFYEVPQGA